MIAFTAFGSPTSGWVQTPEMASQAPCMVRPDKAVRNLPEGRNPDHRETRIEPPAPEGAR